MNIPVNEQETVINFTRDSDKATIYTTDTTMRSKLHNLSMKNGKDWVLLRQDTDCIDHDVISETYQCPKKLISLRALSRTLTEEQRQAAIENIKECAQAAHSNYEWDMEQGYINAIECLEELPSAQPQRMRGKWEKGVGENGVTTSLFCSECNYENTHWYAWNYCPNCGADMRGEQDG